MGFAEIGLVLNRGLVFPRSFFEFSPALQHCAQIAVRFRVIRAAFKRSSKSGFRLRKVSPADHEDAIVVMTLGKIRVDRYQSAVCLFRFFGLPRSGIERNEVCISLAQLWILA